MATGKTVDEVVDIADIQTARRGRRKEINADLLASLASLTEGKAIVLRNAFGSVAADKRATVSGQIRKHWAEAHPGTDCSVNYTPDGVPQVSFRKPKANA